MSEEKKVNLPPKIPIDPFRIKLTPAKGKIHCSCSMCRTKSYDQMSHSDVRKILQMRIYS